MPKIEDNVENDTSATRVTRSLRKRLPVNDTETQKKNTKNSVANMSKEAEKDQEKELISTTMSETRRTRASRSDSPSATTKTEESAPRTPARRVTRRASANEDVVMISTPTRRSRRISHDDVNVFKPSVEKPVTRLRRTPVPITEETEAEERDEAPSPGVRTRSMTVSPRPTTPSRRNSRPERSKTPLEVEKTSNKKDEAENASKEEGDLITAIDETKEPAVEEESQTEKKIEKQEGNKLNPTKEDEKTESESMEKDEKMESVEEDSNKEMKANDSSPTDEKEESEKSSDQNTTSILQETENNESSNKETTSKENDKTSNQEQSEPTKDEPQSETLSQEKVETQQLSKGVSFHASIREQEKSPSRFPKTPITSKSRSYVDKTVGNKENLPDEEKTVSENFCMDTSDIPVEVNPSSTETPKLGLKRCLSAMTSSTPIDSAKNEKILKNTKKETIQEIGSILAGTPEEDVSMEEKTDTRTEATESQTPATHMHEEPKPSTSKSETIECKITKRSINFETEAIVEAGKGSESHTKVTMDIVQETVEEAMEVAEKKEDDNSNALEVAKNILNPQSTEKKDNQETLSVEKSSEKEVCQDVPNPVDVDMGKKDKEEKTSANKITEEKANESDSNEMVIDANDDDTVEMDTLMFSKETQLQTKEKSPKPETSSHMRRTEEKAELKEKNSSTSAITVKDSGPKKSSPFSKSWSHAVKGTPGVDGKNFIDGLGVLDKKEEKVIRSEKKSSKPLQKDEDDEEDLEGEEEYYEEEEEEEKNDFIDDEAEENSQDSMDSSEREYLKQNEIPDEGESIGSDDTESIAEDEDVGEEEEEEEENASFIVSDGEEEAQFSMDTDEDDFLIKNKNKNKKKERKRIRQLDETTDEEVETADKPEKTEDSSEPPEKAENAKELESNEAEPGEEEHPIATESENPTKETETAVDEGTAEENASQAISTIEEQTGDNETSHKDDKNTKKSEDISKDNNESSVEMESVIAKPNIPERMEEEEMDDNISPSQESVNVMERLCVEPETVEGEEGATEESTLVVEDNHDKVSSISQEIGRESNSGVNRRNMSNTSNSSADDERSGNEQIKTKKTEHHKKMKISKDQQEKSDESSSDSDTMIFNSLLATSLSKTDLKTINDKTSESVEVQDENPNDKQVSSNKKKKKKKETISSTQVEHASSSKSKEPTSEAAETNQSEISNTAAAPTKDDKKKKTRTIDDASKYDSILLRCEQILRTHEETKKKTRLENKPKKVKKNKKKKVNEETNVVESKNQEVVQTAPKLQQSLDEPKSKNMEVIEQDSNDDYQSGGNVLKCTNTAEKPETNRKNQKYLFSMLAQQNENIPNIHSIQDTHKITAPSGIFSEETLFSPEKYSRLPEDIKYKIKELLEPYKFDCIVEKCNYTEYELENFDFLYIPPGRSAEGKVKKSKLRKKSSMKPLSSQLLQRKNLQQAFLDDLRFRQWTSLFYQNASSSKMSHEPKVKRKRLATDNNSLEEKIPKKKKRLNILEIISSSGVFKEEPVTPNIKQTHGFIESDIQMPATIGKKVKSIMKADEFEYTRKRTKKIKRKLEITEPMTLLPKPRWTTSGEFTVTSLPNSENSSKILKQIGSSTEFYVEPLKVKKRKLDADVEHRALEFKKSALYNNDRVKRESSKALLQRKKRQEVNNRF